MLKHVLRLNILFYWCPEPDLNRHDRNDRGILSPNLAHFQPITLQPARALAFTLNHYILCGLDQLTSLDFHVKSYA